MLLESLVLSTSGGLAGLALAGLVLRAGKSMLPESSPRGGNRAELERGRVRFAACCCYRAALWVGSGVCRSAHERQQHSERRRPQRFGGRRACAFALHPGGCGDRHCPGSPHGLRVAAAQFRKDARGRSRVPAAARHHGCVFAVRKSNTPPRPPSMRSTKSCCVGCEGFPAPRARVSPRFCPLRTTTITRRLSSTATWPRRERA